MKKAPYNLSHMHSTTADIGTLIPIQAVEVLPGDIVQNNSEIKIQTTPLLSPVNHPVQVTVRSYYVRNANIWDDPGNTSWKNFITGGPDGLDSSTHPYVDLNGQTIAATDIMSRLGMAPPATYAASTKKVNALPLRAFNSIYNEEFMDPDLSTALTIDLTDGADTTTTGTPGSGTQTCPQVCHGKDAYTTARSFQHRGADVTVDLTGTAVITGKDQDILLSNETDATGRILRTTNTGGVDLASNPSASADARWNDPALQASLANVGMTVQDFKIAMATYKFQEKMGRHGGDYEDFMKHWHNLNMDKYLNKPEYLGGGSQLVQFSEVLATDGANTGDIYGHGLGMLRQKRFRKFIPDFGWVITVMFVRPMHILADGMHRSMFKETKFDYYQPEFLNVGDQEVYKQEVYSQTADWGGTFGYNQYGYEYRDQPHRISGEMQTIYDHYHCAKMYGAEPSLNDAFVKVGTGEFDRCLASATNDGFLIQALNNLKMLRPVLRVV